MTYSSDSSQRVPERSICVEVTKSSDFSLWGKHGENQSEKFCLSGLLSEFAPFFFLFYLYILILSYFPFLHNRSVSESVTCSAMYDSFWSHGPSRLLCPWNFPGKNIGVGSHSLFQGIFPTQHCRQILSHLRHQGSPYTTKIKS